MEKIAAYLAIITLIALVIVYGILYFGFDFRWWGWQGFRLLMKVLKRTNRVMTFIETIIANNSDYTAYSYALAA